MIELRHWKEASERASAASKSLAPGVLERWKITPFPRDKVKLTQRKSPSDPYRPSHRGDEVDRRWIYNESGKR